MGIDENFDVQSSAVFNLKSKQQQAASEDISTPERNTRFKLIGQKETDILKNAVSPKIMMETQKFWKF